MIDLRVCPGYHNFTHLIICSLILVWNVRFFFRLTVKCCRNEFWLALTASFSLTHNVLMISKTFKSSQSTKKFGRENWQPLLTLWSLPNLSIIFIRILMWVSVKMLTARGLLFKRQWSTSRASCLWAKCSLLMSQSRLEGSENLLQFTLLPRIRAAEIIKILQHLSLRIRPDFKLWSWLTAWWTLCINLEKHFFLVMMNSWILYLAENELGSYFFDLGFLW